MQALPYNKFLRSSGHRERSQPYIWSNLLADDEAYRENVSKLQCFIGIKTQTALSVITETGDFNRFPDACHYAAYLGLVPGEDSSGGDQHRLAITKAGNRHVRMLLVESAHSFARGKIAYKSRVLAARQEGNSPAVIQYAFRQLNLGNPVTSVLPLDNGHFISVISVLAPGCVMRPVHSGAARNT